MSYSTNILTSLIIFTTATAANAQDFLGIFNPFKPNYNVSQPNYGVTPSNYQYSQPSQNIHQTRYQYTQPSTSTLPCRTNSNSLYGSQTQYPINSTVGLPAACANGQCNHPLHQANGQYTQGYVNGQYSPNITQVNCVNGQCRTGTTGVGQYQNGYFPNSPLSGDRYRTPTNYGNSTIPFNNSQVQYNAPTSPVYQPATFPAYGNTINQPNSSNPYYN
ncbi:hypothetical protein [Thalassoglobus sp.]|uniref:hypothetical protein n=1 Tax=Thalassoglobus sp. TaxID=2795869 RepID=UPI003AA89CEF